MVVIAAERTRPDGSDDGAGLLGIASGTGSLITETLFQAY